MEKINAGISNGLRFLTWLHSAGRNSIVPREIQHEAVESLSVNFLMAIGMAVTAVPALWIKQGSLTVPTKALPVGAPIGLLMALGSISFVLALSELPVGMATGIFGQLRVT